MRQNDGVGQISDVYLASRPSPALPLDYPVWFPLCRLSVYRVEQPPLPHRNIWGALIESLRNGLSAPLRRPHMGDAPIIEQKAGFVPQTTDIPHVIDLDRYYESPAAACVALGIPSRNRSSQS